MSGAVEVSVGALAKLLGIVLTEILKSPTAYRNNDFFRSVLLVAQLLQCESALNAPDYNRIVACTQSLVEVFADATNYMPKNPRQKEIQFDERTIEHHNGILSNYSGVKELSKQTQENQPSGSSGHGRLPHSNVRRCLLYLSLFPEGSVFNRKRTARLFAVRESIPENQIGDLRFTVREYTPEIRIEDLLKEIDECMAVVDRWDKAPCHFQIGNDVREKSRTTWPESRSFHRREAFFQESVVLDPQILPLFSLTFLGPPNQTLDLKDKKFLLLTILTLRCVTLENENNLKKLSLLRYLDLKHSTVRSCDWLEDLKELQLLDLRYTRVELIPDKCLEKLVRLEHLLLGYIPKKGASRLVGAKVSKLNTGNLKTLRSIKKCKVIIEKKKSVRKISDLSVTELQSNELSQFWSAIKNFKNLTSLGVAVTDQSVINLQDCPSVLKKQLKRLRIKGQIDTGSTSAQSRSGFEVLHDFVNLIDLTLVSKMIDSTTSIRTIPNKLQCLRLYGMSKQKTLQFDNRFANLKKLVIGDMRKLETVLVSRAVMERVDTLKLSNLPVFGQLILLESKQPLLRRKDGTQLHVRTFGSQKHIFLKDIGNRTSSTYNFPFEKCFKDLNVYNYDTYKQCYYEVLTSTIRQ